EVVAGGGLGGEDEHARGDVERRILQQATVEGENVEQVEVLALVFVQALDLHVEERVGRHLDAAVGLDDLGEGGLVGALDVHEFLLETGVAGGEFETAEL